MKSIENIRNGAFNMPKHMWLGSILIWSLLKIYVTLFFGSIFAMKSIENIRNSIFNMQYRR